MVEGRGRMMGKGRGDGLSLDVSSSGMRGEGNHQMTDTEVTNNNHGTDIPCVGEPVPNLTKPCHPVEEYDDETTSRATSTSLESIANTDATANHTPRHLLFSSLIDTKAGKRYGLKVFHIHDEKRRVGEVGLCFSIF